MSDLNRSTDNTYKRILLSVALTAAFATSAATGQSGYPQQGNGLPVYGQAAYGQPGYGDDTPGQADPPSRVARVSVAAGNVSIEPASINQFNVAEPNYPMTTGDRIYADVGADVEIQTGQLAVRLGQQTDLTVTAMTDSLAQFGIAQGSVHLRSYNVYQGETVEMDTPNVAVTILQAGDVRVDVDPANDVTMVFVLNGQAEVYGNGVNQVMQAGERLRLSGSNPVYAEVVTGPRRGFGGFLGQILQPQDGLDRFSLQRDQLYESAYASEAQYVNPGTIGAEDLNTYGTWENDGDYGGVWYPQNVSADWQPYRNGHWTWVAPWGWTWIEAEPWGFAPFHYGRWNRFGNRWGWIPEPTVVRPIYSPALVVFVGGGNLGGGNYGRGGGGGVTAWFPLGPREAYQPWYHTSPQYVNRVNVSNIYDRNTVNVRNVYNQRTVVNTYVNVDNRSYTNRQQATVAMGQDNFARGGRADQGQVRVDPRQLQGAPILPHPLVTPERSMVAPAAARSLPTVQARPTLASHEDGGRGGQFGGQRGPQGGQQNVPNQPAQTQPANGQQNGQRGQFGGMPNTQQPTRVTPPVQQAPVQQPVQTQPANGQQSGRDERQQRGQFGGQVNGQVNAQTPPVQATPVRVQPQAPVQQQPARVQEQVPVQQQPVQQQNGQRGQFGGQQNTQQQQPARVTPPVQQAPVQAVQTQQPQQQRVLVNRAVPPEPRPSFDQQRQAIQSTDPGRPLGPQQLQNLRQNQPAGQPQQKELVHPDQTTNPRPRGGPVKPIDPQKN